MKKIIFLSACTILLLSCKVQKEITSGVFRHTDKYNMTEQLILRADSTFTLNTYGGSPYYATCQGKWEYISKDTIIIHCGLNEILDFFDPNIITYRTTRKIKIITSNKITMLQTYGNADKYIKLKRVTSAYTEENWKKDRYME